MRFGDDPYAGFGPVEAGDHTADIVTIDGNGGLRIQPRRGGREDDCNGNGRHAGI